MLRVLGLGVRGCVLVYGVQGEGPLFFPMFWAPKDEIHYQIFRKKLTCGPNLESVGFMALQIENLTLKS